MSSPTYSSQARAPIARRILNTVLDSVFPQTCTLCAKGLNTGELKLCSNCQKLLRSDTAAPACPRCGHSTGPYGVHEGRCAACRNEGRAVDGLVRIGAYRESVANLVLAFKYGGRDDLDRMLGSLLAEIIGLTDWGSSVDALVVVPSHWSRAFRRSYYAPTVLSRAVSRASGIPTAPVLRRVAAGPHQFELPRSKRAENIRGKFAMCRGAAVRGAFVCLVDDVSTTGATLNECARVLKAAGARSVTAAVIAKVNTDRQVLGGV